MAREPFTYPFCYTPAPDIVAAAARLIAWLDGFGSRSGIRGSENFASLIPPTPDGAGPSRSRATGGYGFSRASLPLTFVFRSNCFKYLQRGVRVFPGWEFCCNLVDLTKLNNP